MRRYTLVTGVLLVLLAAPLAAQTTKPTLADWFNNLNTAIDNSGSGFSTDQKQTLKDLVATTQTLALAGKLAPVVITKLLSAVLCQHVKDIQNNYGETPDGARSSLSGDPIAGAVTGINDDVLPQPVTMASPDGTPGFVQAGCTVEVFDRTAVESNPAEKEAIVTGNIIRSSAGFFTGGTFVARGSPTGGTYSISETGITPIISMARHPKGIDVNTGNFDLYYPRAGRHRITVTYTAPDGSTCEMMFEVFVTR